MLELKLRCSKCKQPLEAKWLMDGELEVTPCWDCLKNAFLTGGNEDAQMRVAICPGDLEQELSHG